MARRTPGLEEYLESLYKLSDGRPGEPVTTSALALDLGVAPASVTEMVKRLGDQGLVQHVPYKGASLTETGLAEGATMVRNHRLWERFLVDILHMDWDQVHDEACALEHATSPHLAEHLAAFLSNPQTCPHGYPLPPVTATSAGRPVTAEHSASAGSPNAAGRLLYDLEPGFAGEVSAVEETPELLRYCAEAGLVPGARVEVLSRHPVEPILEVRVGESGQAAGRTLSVGPRLGRCVRVKQEGQR